MIVLDILYNLLIGPLELLFEVIYSISYRIIGDPGLAVVCLSLAMNILVFPLYRRADAIQEEERDRAASMKHWTDHIRKTFKGDERFMMLQTYNRQCGYKPTDALRGSVSLLLEIPFFIAAFHFLSNLPLLNGVSFGPIADLGAPDGLLQIGELSINVLPLIMTAINIVSAAIYMKGFPLKNKIQMYGIAAIFLVLLYASPAGLVFYWTLNNLFSLVKNIFYKLKNPKLALCALVSVVGLALLGYVLLIQPASQTSLQALAIAAGVALQIPIVIHLWRKRHPRTSRAATAQPDGRAFLFGCIFLAVLTGLLIPSSVVSASPEEFVNIAAYESPLFDLARSLSLAIGMFVIWFGVFYRLATSRGKTILEYLILFACLAAVIGYLFFGTEYGNLSAQLQYDSVPTVASLDLIVNLAVLGALAGALLLVWKHRKVFMRPALACMCVAIVAVSAVNLYGINRDLEPIQKTVDQSPGGQRASVTFSKQGENVIVIMLDRAVSDYLPYIMHENDTLKRQFDGFTFYSNALSYGSWTNVGTPGLYGGYDYTPAKINERSDEPLCDKQNEALKVMPTVFSNAGYGVTVFDPTYAGYTWIPDLSIYDDCPGVEAYITMDGSFKPSELADVYESASQESRRPRTFFCYSIFRISPLVFQPTLYNKGDYNVISTGILNMQVRENSSVAQGMDKHFSDAYGVLQALPSLTKIEEDAPNRFLMMSNDTTHQPIVLKEPDYTPSLSVNNLEYDAEHPSRFDDDGNELELPLETSGSNKLSKVMHYHVNMAALRELGNWFDYLRENEIYDNTRIIIVSDHGRMLKLEPKLRIKTGEGKDAPKRDVEAFECLLMVKDFNARGLSTDKTFMTNADVPALALRDIVDNPKNPFTGNALNDARDKEDGVDVLYSSDWNTSKNDGTTFMPGDWFSVHDDVHKKSNWTYLGKY